jgi:hypothetical protein
MVEGNNSRKLIQSMVMCSLITVLIGALLCGIAIISGNGSIAYSIVFFIHRPALELAQIVLSFINRADAFGLIIPVLLLYWLLIGFIIALLKNNLSQRKFKKNE